MAQCDDGEIREEPPSIAPVVDEKAEGSSTRQATRVCGALVARRHVSFTWRTAQWPVQPDGPWWRSNVGLVTRKRQKAVEVDVRVVELLPGAGAPAKPQSRKRYFAVPDHTGGGHSTAS